MNITHLQNVCDPLKEFKCIKELDPGAYSNVYVYETKPGGKKFVIKKVIKDIEKHVRNECITLALCKHENIIQMYQYMHYKHHLYIYLEYISDQTLYDYVHEYFPIGNHTLKHIFYQILNGLTYLHNNNIYHRDIKLENIIIDKYNMIKIIDFGLSVTCHTKRLNKEYCGSLSYCAPEIVHKIPYDPEKADIYSFGIVMFSCCAQYHPFTDNQILTNRRELIFAPEDNVHEKYQRLITLTLNEDPLLRPTAKFLKNQLQQYNAMHKILTFLK